MTERDSLNRFLKAQEGYYQMAQEEIQNGKKRTHWIWFIFPQLRGLGRSEMADLYGIQGLGEARAYLAHPVLSARLSEITKAMLAHKEKSAEEILGELDAMKLRSSMTFFALISEEGSVFHQVLDGFYQGKMDPATVALIKQAK